MESSSRAVIGAVIFIVLIVGVNLMMYAVVRGVMRGGGKSPLDTLMRSVNSTEKKQPDEMDQLRRSVQTLQEAEKKPDGEDQAQGPR